EQGPVELGLAGLLALREARGDRLLELLALPGALLVRDGEALLEVVGGLLAEALLVLLDVLLAPGVAHDLDDLLLLDRLLGRELGGHGEGIEVERLLLALLALLAQLPGRARDLLPAARAEDVAEDFLHGL